MGKCMSEEIECIKKMLEDHGIAHTHQREEILSLFITESKHYKPDEIFKLLRCKGIGIATVYRTLEMLRKCNVIKEISIGKERFYELKKNESKSIYVHFKCDICGEFFDYFDIETVKSYDEALVSIEKKMDVIIRDVNITVNGICSKCKI
jgi:Fe2+ or Zn2+ uptake regulation protein